jgi:hypothetical protein
MSRFSIITLLSLTLLAACGGGDQLGSNGTGTGSSGGSSSGGSSGGTGVAATSLTAQSSATTIPADGSATAIITVLARNSSNELISGVDVTFAASAGGAIAVTQATTGTNGAATATLSAVGATVGSNITVTATAGSLDATVTLGVVSTSTAATTAVASLNLSTSTASILSDGSTTATITALALDASSNVLSGVPVTFKTTATGTGTPGALQANGSTTGADGTLTAVLSTGGNSEIRTITVTGTTATLSSQVTVSVIPPPTPVMGNGTGSGFVPNVIGLGTTGTLSAGGTTSLAVTITVQGGVLYNAGPVTVSFNSTCLANGQAEILPSGSSTPAQSITTTTGSIGATYVAKGCSGADLITASATVGNQPPITATATVTIATAAIGSIQFISAMPTTIGLKGTGLNETSTVIFKVVDATGGPEAGISVAFALNTGVGGLSLSPTTAVSASDGTVQTVVSAGTVHSVVRVTASIASPALSTQSSQLTVTTGLPTSGAFSIAIGAPSGTYSSALACPNVEAFGVDGTIVPLTVRLADRYNNPAPDGTSVAFTTDGGHIVGSCTTGAVPGDGTCTASWTSANPRPGQDPYTLAIDLFYGYPASYAPSLLRAGRATVLATTIGEESFTDDNGSGFYQVGDPFANLGEPFEDDNEDGAYELGESYIDFNHNGTRDAGTGSFVGITCTGTTPSDTCSTSTLAIGASHLVIMSTSNSKTPTLVNQAGFTGSVAGLTITNGETGTVIFNIQDQNGNAMAAGTGVAITFVSNGSSGATLTQAPPTSFGCDSDVGGEDFAATLTTTLGQTGSGNLIVTVTSPIGSQTSLVIGVQIN